MREWINKYGGLVGITVIVVLAMIGMTMIGCNPATCSPLDPARTVDRVGLANDLDTFAESLGMERAKIASLSETSLAEIKKAEAIYNAKVVAFNAKSKTALSEIERQEARNASLFDLASVTAVSAANGSINPAGLLVTALAFVGGWLGLKRPGDKTSAQADSEYDEAITLGNQLPKTSP